MESDTDSTNRNIVKGIFNSDKGNLIQNVANIPCDTIETLESDADEAEQFVSQIQAGQVPSAITDLPQEAVSEFGDIIDVATMVIDDVAGAAVTDVVNVFNEIEDGSIVSVVAGIPSDIIDAITNGWDDFTSEVQSAWGGFTCFFEGDCSSTSSAGFCLMPAAASASATANAAATSASASASATANAAAASASAYYASESSASAAAAANSQYYASESSATAAAAYTSSYYASESAAYQAESTTTTTPTTTSSLQNGAPIVTPSPAAQSSTSQPTQPAPHSSKGIMSHGMAESHCLATTAMIVIGLALWL